MKAKQGLFLILALLIGGAAAGGAAAAYYWNRATAFPTWYTSSGEDSDLATTVESGSNLLEAKLSSGEGVQYLDNRQVAITLSAPELNQLIQTGVAQSPTAAPLVAASRGVKASIEGNRLRAGMVVNPAEISLDGLPANTQQSVRQAIEALPLLGDRDLYVGITGSPRVENGRLILGDDTHVQIGNVKLSMAEVARLTGLSPAQLTEQLNLALPQAGVTLDGMEFVDGQAVIRGRQD